MSSIITIGVIIVLISFISYKWDLWSVKKVQYKRYFDKNKAFEGDVLTLTTEIINKKLLPLPWIEVVTHIPDSIVFDNQKVKSIRYTRKKLYSIITSLFSFQRVRKTDTFKCIRRGYYNFNDDIKIITGDYFGMSNGKLILKHPIELTIYPKVQPLETLIIPYKRPQGEISVKRWILEDPMQIVGVRQYTNRDSFNSIDWKATAKLNSLHVKKYDFTAEPSVTVFLNVQTNKIHWVENDAEFIENGIRIAASITNKGIKEKVPIGFASNAYLKGYKNNDFISPSSNKKQEMLILDSLARISYERQIPIEKLVSSKAKLMGNNNVIIIITSFISDELKKELNYLAKSRYIIKIILPNNNLNLVGLHKNIEIMYSKTEEKITVSEGGVV